MKYLLPILIFLSITCAAAQTPTPPNMLVICIDSLRYDRATDPDIMPNLSRFASNNVSFTRAHAAAPWTLPSVASFFTGKLPSASGVMFPGDIIPDSEVTLAETLQINGWDTIGITANVTLSDSRGFTQGFNTWIDVDELIEVKPEPFWAPANMVTSIAVDNIPESTPEPFFMYVHYMEPHLPYRPPDGLRMAYARGSGRFESQSGPLSNIRNMAPVTDDEIEQLRGLYDAECAFADYEIEKLFQAIHDKGLSEDTLIFIYADHGEELGERGDWGHGHSMYEELLHVPVMMEVPSGMPFIADLQDELINLPTMRDMILHVLGFENTVTVQHSYLSEAMMMSDQEKKALVRYDGWKFIWSIDTQAMELYNLPFDPGEVDNRYDGNVELGAEMLSEILSQVGLVQTDRDRELEIEQLRALGYLH